MNVEIYDNLALYPTALKLPKQSETDWCSVLSSGEVRNEAR